MQVEATALERCSDLGEWVVGCFGEGEVTAEDGEVLPCLLLELCPDGDLLSKIAGVGLPPEQAHGFMKDVANGLLKVHDRMVVHRDLKCSNLLLVNKNGFHKVKLADFGAAHVLESLAHSASTWLAGTPVNRAPEMVAGKTHGLPVDVFMFALLLLEIRFGELAFWYLLPDAVNDISQEERVQRRGSPAVEVRRVDCPYNKDSPKPGWVRLAPVEHEFLVQCFQPDPNARVTLQQLFSSQYLQLGKEDH
jgi:serine/threonine protein kinase